MIALVVDFCLDPLTYKNKFKENKAHEWHINLELVVGLVGVFVFAKCHFPLAPSRMSVPSHGHLGKARELQVITSIKLPQFFHFTKELNFTILSLNFLF